MGHPIAFKQIVHTWMYGNLEIEPIAKSIRRIGLDGADLSVSNTDAHNHISLFENINLKEIFERNGVAINIMSALMYSDDVDMSSNDPAIRENAKKYVKRLVALSAKVQCKRVLVVPSWISGNHRYHVSREEDWKMAVESLRELASFSDSYGITLMIEPVNRYRVGLVHTISEAIKMISDIGLPGVSIVPDTFHMNIEEANDIPAALIYGGKYIKALHIGENNRRAPGSGALDWPAILLALKKIEFDGCLSHEPVSLYFDQYKVASDPERLMAFEHELSTSAEYLRRCMEDLSER